MCKVQSSVSVKKKKKKRKASYLHWSRISCPCPNHRQHTTTAVALPITGPAMGTTTATSSSLFLWWRLKHRCLLSLPPYQPWLPGRHSRYQAKEEGTSQMTYKKQKKTEVTTTRWEVKFVLTGVGVIPLFSPAVVGESWWWISWFP